MSPVQPKSPALGPMHALSMFVDPGAVFRRIADAPGYGWLLATIIVLSALLGWARMQTGLIEREIDARTQQALGDVEREQSDLLTRVELSDRMDQIRKSAEFAKLIARGSAIAAAPIVLAASLALIAAVFFAVVALAGAKPDYAILMAVCTYSAVTDVLASGLRLVMMLAFRTIEVDTSLALLAPVANDAMSQAALLPRALSAIDPFRVWFWILVGVGVVASGQLSRRAAVLTCGVLFLIAAGVRMIPLPASMMVGLFG